MSFWDTVFINPMINGLVVLEQLLFGNFGLAIIVFTVMVRGATLPLTLRQLRSSRRMQAIQPQMQELQKKYKDPKRRQEEMMKLYREHGVNPLGCLGPMIIQFPIWIALYRVLSLTVAGTPERTVELSHRLYPWSFIQSAVPLPTHFLFLDLGRQDTSYIMFVLVGITTWLQTKLSITQTAVTNPTQQQTNQMLLWMMPLMFAWFTLSVPSGLAMYWVVTNTIGIVMNYYVYGWHKRPITDLFRPADTDGKRGARRTKPGPRPTRPGQAALTDADISSYDADTRRPARGGARNKRAPDGKPGDKRKNGRGGGREGSEAAGSGPLPGRGRDS